MKRSIRALLFGVVGCTAFAVMAQTPVPPAIPKIPPPIAAPTQAQPINPITAQPTTTVPRVDGTITPPNLPPGPTITDWQPRGHVAVGGKLTITGPQLQPGELIVAFGPARRRLAIQQSTSTVGHIEIIATDDTLGQGTLAVGYAATAATVLDTNYSIAMPQPSIASASAGSSDLYPLMKRVLNVTLHEFPGATLDLDGSTFGGSCGFTKQGGIVYQPAQRAADLSIAFNVIGYFMSAGNCTVQMTLKPRTATGASLSAITLSAPIAVKQPATYTFSNSNALTSRITPLTLTNFGVGSICTGTLPNGNAVGQAENSSDFAVVERGGPGDVSCGFRSKEWLLPEGVRLKDIHWRVVKQGNRCGLFGDFSGTLPLINVLPTRGTVFVKPEANMLASDFTAFGDQNIVYDGVSYQTGLSAPRSMILPMTFGIQCASMLVPLQTSSGTSPPTTDPQAWAIVLDSVTLEGPPGLTLP